MNPCEHDVLPFVGMHFPFICGSGGVLFGGPPVLVDETFLFFHLIVFVVLEAPSAQPPNHLSACHNDCIELSSREHKV